MSARFPFIEQLAQSN